ncbi:MAG: YdcF family protein [Bacteroidia bacterium]
MQFLAKWVTVNNIFILIVGYFLYSKDITIGVISCLAFVIVYVSPFAELSINRLEQPIKTSLFQKSWDELTVPINILILGAGRAYKNKHWLSQLTCTQIRRAIIAVETFKMLKGDVTLICSGHSKPGYKSQAHLTSEFCARMGVPKSKIKMLDKSYNTRSEANDYIKYHPKESMLVIISSARHARRALFYFNRLNISRVCFIPSDYIGFENISFRCWKLDFGKGRLLQKSIYERLALLKAKY